LLGAGKILKIGEVSRQAIESLHIVLDVVDATDCIVTPGFIDSHEHLLDRSGEKSFAAQTPEIYPLNTAKIKNESQQSQSWLSFSRKIKNHKNRKS